MSLRAGSPISVRCTLIPVVSVFLALLSCGLPSLAAAQERTGFWIGFGLGAGSTGISADNVAGRISGEDRDEGAVGDLGLGWTLNHQLLLGVELKVNTSAQPSEGKTFSTFSMTLADWLGTLTFYPSRSSGFFVKAGAGVSHVDFDIEWPETIESPEFATLVFVDGPRFRGTVGKGFGLMTGAGYDLRLGRGFSLVPELTFRYGRPGDIDVGGITQFKNWTHNTIDAKASIVFHQTRK